MSAGAAASASTPLLTSVAVDNSMSPSQDPSTGDLYIGTEEGTLYQANAANEFLGGFSMPERGRIAAVAVDSSGTASTGTVYVANLQGGVVYELNRFRLNGPSGGEYQIVHEFAGLSRPAALTVDVAGNLYVAQTGAEDVIEFSSSGEPLNEGKPVVEGLSGAQGIAVDARGDLYVATGGAMGTVEFEPAAGGGFSAPATIDRTGVGVTVDSSTGEVYVIGTSSCGEPGGASFSIAEFSASGSPIGERNCIFGTPSALAESESTHTVYVTAWNSFEGSQLLSFGPKPTIVGESSGEVAMGGATLSGTINPENDPTHYYFKYGTTTTYEARTSLQEVPAGAVDVEVGPQALTGLSPNTEYHYRLIAENAAGVTEGEDRVFRTLTSNTAGMGTVQGLGPDFVTQPVVAAGGYAEPVPAEPSFKKTAPRKLTRAQKLAKALKACKKKSRIIRTDCERRVRTQYRRTINTRASRLRRQHQK